MQQAPNPNGSSSSSLNTGLPLVISATLIGVLFALVAAQRPWLPPLTVALACIATGIDRWFVISRSGEKAAKRWELIDEPRAYELAAQHGVTLRGTLSVPLPGAFWIHTSSRSGNPEGYIALGDLVKGEHLDAVITHELGHAHHNHLVKRSKATVIAVAAGFIPAFAAPLGVVPTALISLATLFAASVLFCAMCRRQELQADRFAALAGPNPASNEAVLALLESLAQFSPPAGLWELHPPLAARRVALKRLSRQRAMLAQA
jgi:Zn-dependent protease with chaperone function